MPANAKEALLEAADGFAVFPSPIEDLKIKDNILNAADWDEFNQRLCDILRRDNRPLQESMIDRFWKKNKTFGELIIYINDHCFEAE